MRSTRSCKYGDCHSGSDYRSKTCNSKTCPGRYRLVKMKVIIVLTVNISSMCVMSTVTMVSTSHSKVLFWPNTVASTGQGFKN